MSVLLEVHPAASSIVLPLVQAAITGLSVCVALASAFITRSNFRASRQDRLEAQQMEIVAALSEVWKLSEALDRAIQALDPMIASAERERLRSSALLEVGAVNPKTIWPHSFDKAHITIRRILEDTPAASSATELELAIATLTPLHQVIAVDAQTLEKSAQEVVKRLAKLDKSYRKCKA